MTIFHPPRIEPLVMRIVGNGFMSRLLVQQHRWDLADVPWCARFGRPDAERLRGRLIEILSDNELRIVIGDEDRGEDHVVQGAPAFVPLFDEPVPIEQVPTPRRVAILSALRTRAGIDVPVFRCRILPADRSPSKKGLETSKVNYVVRRTRLGHIQDGWCLLDSVHRRFAAMIKSEGRFVEEIDAFSYADDVAMLDSWQDAGERAEIPSRYVDYAKARELERQREVELHWQEDLDLALMDF